MAQDGEYPADEYLMRIAQALERLSPPPLPPVNLCDHPAYYWDGHDIAVIENFDPLPLPLIAGVDRQSAAILENSRRHAMGYGAHDILLWGARGMGKSALVKSAINALQGAELPIALVGALVEHIASLSLLFRKLAGVERQFVLFIDDMAFDGDDAAPRMLRSMLEGGAQARPANVRLYVTSNRRNIVERTNVDDKASLNQRDLMDDQLALADRFGLKLGFQYPDQAGFLAMVSAYARHYDLPWDEADALAFARMRGGRSGRVAWHYAVDLAGRAGRKI